ncbi:MAG: FecR domain-containing protein [Bacteroidales bacterium]|nr:FecR domain-containing protein [Bacteroidales bacterium]
MNRENKHEIPDLPDIGLFGIDTNAEWSKFRSAAGISGPKTLRLSSLWKVAASVILVAGAGLLAYNKANAPREENFVAENTAIETTVETSTQISLNCNSSIVCTDNRADGKYNVRLSGEAYFDVEKNPERTFQISTENVTVTVHGTSFDVCENSNGTTVTVTSGNVEVTSNNTGESIANLTRGKQITCSSNGKMEVRDVENFNCIAWKLHKLEFNNNSMEEIMRNIAQAYNIKYSFADSETAAATLTGTFEAQSLESIIKVLEQTLDIKIQQNGDSYIISK